MTLSPGLKPCCISLTTVPGPTLEGSLLEADRFIRGSFQGFRHCACVPCRWDLLIWVDMGVERLHFKALQQSHNDCHCRWFRPAGFARLHLTLITIAPW